ncbi:DUF6401 family natural product biosynthesis protein [Pseudonocardia cypriaca]|uniref:Uncharacterized protein n=1 Tax=Pseudonocardia cypriaca TaxID=882449 RepID=A0A543FYR6_9PSEU|nr:DUF6401 family natural product biosynthesis protein [Pseudonocardia cypriaca]TQM38983.1 hypothetical protein FB388_6235 [Pseudonocardia cypriaca]
MAGFFDHVADHHAQRWLSGVMDQLGDAGLAAAAAVPALLAAVDQHAAGVRDILLLGVEGAAVAAGAVLLAGYAKGLLDQAGTDPARLRAAVGDGWHRADWLTLRVLAVCALSRDDRWHRTPAPLFEA